MYTYSYASDNNMQADKRQVLFLYINVVIVDGGSVVATEKYVHTWPMVMKPPRIAVMLTPLNSASARSSRHTRYKPSIACW